MWLVDAAPGVTLSLANLDLTQVATFISALGAAVIGIASIVVNRRGASESRLQQTAANELERRSQGFEEMQALAAQRSSDLREEREENARLRRENAELRREILDLRNLTRAQIALAETHDLLPPRAGGAT